MTRLVRGPQSTSAIDAPLCRDAETSFSALADVTFEPHTATLPGLLELLVKPGRREDCRRLLDAHDWQLRRLADASIPELCGFGFTPGAAERLSAVFALARRFGEEEWLPGEHFQSSYDVYQHFRERLAAAPIEYFIAVLLDTKNRKIRDVIISQGSVNASIVCPRDAFLPAVRFSAAAVIFVHCHPSGDPSPSPEDIDITRRLRQAGEMLSIRVLDHVVIGKGRYVSFVDDGFWAQTTP